MRKQMNRREQRGVALLVALFALLLLSAIGMGMMFSANTETTINSNYREKQIATYAALAGLQEGKDRLVIGSGDIPWPTALPDPNLPNVVYIINPAGMESVTPWTADTKFADTELCHERTLGITGVAALSDACSGSSSLPTTGNWYVHPVRDNSSASYTGPYKLNPPLPYKWVRIQLKANNNTPFPANGDTSNATQLCWTGLNQVPLPPGYTTACIPNGAITKITMTNGGSNYTQVPNVVIGPPPTGGTQATATAVLTNISGVLSGVAVDDGGSGYVVAPTVTISGGGGSGAVATATIVPAGAPVQSVTLNSTPPSTACWPGPGKPTVNLVFSGGGGGMGATGTATLSSGYNCISNISFTDGTCAHGTGGTLQTFTTSGGNGNFSATVLIPGSRLLKQAGTPNILNPGSGYNSTSPAITFTGSPDPGCTSVAATATLGYTLTGVTLGAGGAGYTSPPAVTFTPAPSFGSASVSSSVGANAAGAVISISLTSGGTGYTDPSTLSVTLTGGCVVGSPDQSCLTKVAKAHAVFPGTITGVNLTNYGAGYRAVPSVSIVPKPGDTGSGATAIATIQGGPWYSPVMLLTSLGVSPGGARTMAQMEVAPSIRGLQMPGALTLAGPQPSVTAPDSSNFNVDGTDHPNGYIDPVKGATGTPPPGCDTTATTSHPAVGAYDNPDAPTSPSSVADILAAIPAGRATTNYNGINRSPDVENVYGALGDQGTTPSGLDSLVASIASMPGANIYASNPASIAMGSPSNPVIDVVNGSLTFNGTATGYGILVVTGDFQVNGNITWNGLVLVIGTGNMQVSGGGGGTVNGSVIVAQTHDPTTGALLSTLGQPTLNWSGGGGNGIYYDHCWADYMLNMIPYNAPDSTKPLAILSVRTLSY